MNTNLLSFPKLMALISALIFMPLSILTYGIDLISAGQRTDASKINVAGISAYTHSQGIASDGEHFYFSSKTTLICTESDAVTLVRANYSAITDELKTLGIKHIGGISFYNGRIYAGMEDSKVWDYPIIGVFSADTLQLEAYYIMDSELITRGMPWVTVDPDTGYLYCMDHSKKPTKLLAYDTADSMKSVGEIPLSETVESIQGAEFNNGTMYVATNDSTQAIYKIDVSTGNVEKVIDRNLTKGSEGEGMTFMNGRLYAMDMGPIFVNAFVRGYNTD